MDTIIELLKERNHFLQKFCDLNEKELISFSEGDFQNLDRFYESREKILGIVSELDKLIEQQCASDFKEESTAYQKKDIIKELDFKNELVTRILSQDLQALSFIESEKSDIIRELTSIQTGKKAIGSYKSGNKKRSLDEKI